jgi:hypothetical protein
MNDNKDITEFEYEIEAIINRATSISGELDIKEVINCLREIMLPTCTLNERKFLDEAKKIPKFKWRREPLKTPHYKLVTKNDSTAFYFCNQYGEILINPQSPGAKSYMFYRNYDIGIAEWDYDGRLIRFLKDLEFNSDAKHLYTPKQLQDLDSRNRPIINTPDTNLQ